MSYPHNEIDIKYLTDKGKIFYKFSKSKEDFKELTFEQFHKNYPEFSIIQADGYHGLSFCDDLSKLLLCAGYGDQITQVIIDKSSPYFDAIEEHLEKELEEYSRFGEYTTFVMQTGKNYSLSDPSVVNALIQSANMEGLSFFLNYTNHGKTIEEIYEDFGFDESAQFIHDIKEKFTQKYRNLFMLQSGETREYLNKIANELVLNYCDKDSLFSFEKAENDYELNKDKITDRRFEKVNLVKEGETIDDMFSDVAYYLHLSHFSKWQAGKIAEILTENNLYEPAKLNEILPKFSRNFSDELFLQIKHDIRNNKLDYSQILNLLDERRKDAFTRKENLFEKINNKIKDFNAQKSNKFLSLQEMEINYRFER